ncbi:hypothetical protein [Acinetobacter johnsonii]|uniref:Uncharacterized protein n=1 Tax=Acinetobacter johnsonii SH046 TaxID=575586 RepID=D0SBZ2_ACIJO|nr:hypothetical protein [Acinetobacter johnsonii]EEY96674.1 hypothetical protein HMPREF0016_01365 [Acinetobacter johnsonii SH046]QPF34135.1 hypothetical protein H0S57_11655 [Acinetobacter johnsonii]HRM31942.1 hypothetical protein [Acinetobacter johnsonii]
MNHYQKTALGLDALQQRHIPLNARQRRLLVLIGTEDFEQLADQFKQRIATPEILEQLIELGLIHSTQTSHAPSPIQSEPPPPASVLEISQNNVNPIDLDSTAQPPTPPAPTQSPAPPLKAYSFEETRNLMMSLLQRYCGLMAKQLILQIQSATDLHSLKRCQMQWITTLQESRIEPIVLNQHLQQINHSLLRLQAA